MLQRFLISGVKLGNRCRDCPIFALLRAVILDFKARLGNRCRVFPGNAHKCASILDFKPKLENRCRGEWFRLLRSWRQRFSASDSNFRSGKEEWPTASHRRCGKEEWPAFRMTVADAGGDSLPRRRHNPKLKAAGVVTVPVGSRCRSRSVIFRRLPMSVSQRNVGSRCRFRSASYLAESKSRMSRGCSFSQASTLAIFS